MQENIIYGIRAVIEAISAGKKIDKIVARKALSGELFGELQKLCKQKGIRMQFADADVIDRITTANHQGVVAMLSHISYVGIDQIDDIARAASEQPLVLLFDGITDVRNLGAIVRSADCAGVHAIIVPEKGSAPINGESVKTSAGAMHYMPICTTKNTYFALRALKDKGYRIVGATEHGAEDYHKVDFTGPVVIVMGAEDKGISNQLLKLCDQNAKIDMYGHIESLNVSVAAGIILFEAAYQRHKL